MSRVNHKLKTNNNLKYTSAPAHFLTYQQSYAVLHRQAPTSCVPSIHALTRTISKVTIINKEVNSLQSHLSCMKTSTCFFSVLVPISVFMTLLTAVNYPLLLLLISVLLLLLLHVYYSKKAQRSMGKSHFLFLSLFLHFTYLTHTPLSQQSLSGLTMLLSRHNWGTYPETSSHATCQGTFGHSRLSSLSHNGLILA